MACKDNYLPFTGLHEPSQGRPQPVIVIEDKAVIKNQRHLPVVPDDQPGGSQTGGNDQSSSTTTTVTTTAKKTPKDGSLPRAGDSTLTLVLGLLVAAAAVLGIALVLRKRSRR